LVLRGPANSAPKINCTPKLGDLNQLKFIPSIILILNIFSFGNASRESRKLELILSTRRFTKAFFVQNFGAKNYKAVFRFEIFWAKISYKKLACKTFLKLTSGD
jgi:hypothetical protein